MSFLGDIRRQQLDIQRVASKSPQYPSMGQGMVLMKVISSTLITGSDKRYLYTLREAVVSASPTYAPTQSVNLPQYFGLSVSELSNAGPTYAYGITAGNVPGGFNAVAIPNNSYCAAFPHYTTEGDVVFLIVNTQAIDGSCNQLIADDDYGTYASPGALDSEYGTFDAPQGDVDYGVY